MANKAELWDQLAEAIKIIDQLWKYAATNTPNFLSDLQTLEADYKGNHIATTAAAFSSVRSTLSSLCISTTPLSALIIELAKIGYDSISSDVYTALDDIAQGMHDGSETVRYRNWTHGSVSAGGSNVGTGTLYRCVTDKNTYEIESGYADAGVIKCNINSDKNSGATSGNEFALMYGSGEVQQDEIELGDATNSTLSMVAVRSQDGFLSNPSFETMSGTDTDKFTGWLINGTAGNCQQEATPLYYRVPPGSSDNTGTALEFIDNDTITQWMSDMANQIDPTKPVFLIVRYARKSSCDGSLTIRLGSQTEQVADLTTKVDATWYDLCIGIDDENGWYDNFKEDNDNKGVRVAITLASRTTGSLLIDDIILAQPVEFDGKYYMLTAGATDFLKEDYFTYTDSVANTGRNQYWLSRIFKKYLPHATSGETYADAT